MRRSFAAAALVVATAAAVAAATLAPIAGAVAPAKTTTPGPGPTAPPTTGPIGPTTTLGPPTTSPTATTSPLPGTTTPLPTPPPVTTAPATTVAGTFAPPPSTVAPVPFESTTFFSEFYAHMALEPTAAIDLLQASVDFGSAADSFLYHDLLAAIAIFRNTTTPMPTYTVTPSGAAISVCRIDGACDTLADFVVEGGFLTSFTIDGQPIEPRVSVYERQTTVEALTINVTFAVRRPRDEALSIALFFESVGAGTSMAWEQATYEDSTGRQYPIDLAQSQYPTRIEADDVNAAHVVFPGAQHGGQLVVPITTDLTGVATTVRIPIVLTT